MDCESFPSANVTRSFLHLVLNIDPLVYNVAQETAAMFLFESSLRFHLHVFSNAGVPKEVLNSFFEKANVPKDRYALCKCEPNMSLCHISVSCLPSNTIIVDHPQNWPRFAGTYNVLIGSDWSMLNRYLARVKSHLMAAAAANTTTTTTSTSTTVAPQGSVPSSTSVAVGGGVVHAGRWGDIRAFLKNDRFVAGHMYKVFFQSVDLPGGLVGGSSRAAAGLMPRPQPHRQGSKSRLPAAAAAVPAHNPAAASATGDALKKMVSLPNLRGTASKGMTCDDGRGTAFIDGGVSTYALLAAQQKRHHHHPGAYVQARSAAAPLSSDAPAPVVVPRAIAERVGDVGIGTFHVPQETTDLSLSKLSEDNLKGYRSRVMDESARRIWISVWSRVVFGETMGLRTRIEGLQ